jgi:vitamin B12 transporter
MLRMLKINILIIIFAMISNSVIAADIPVIVISPSQKAQSKSTVGTSVTVYDEAYIENHNGYFLGDVIGSGGPSMNKFQTGGYGSTSGVQLRGLPKRYSTVYIDGVKQYDPGSPSGDFDFSTLLKDQIARVEILRGNQTSVYGSGSMGGAIIITTKKGKPGFKRNINAKTGSNGTHNLALSMSGADEKNDFYLGLERFVTQGISAMTDNDEDDGYDNNTLAGNYGYKFTDKIKLENSLRYMIANTEFDTVKRTTVRALHDDDEQKQDEFSLATSLLFDPNEQFSNKLTFSKYNMKRTSNVATDAQDDYKGDRKALGYLGTYNFDLDSSIIIGADVAFETMNQTSDIAYLKQGATTDSIYVDYQQRLNENIYATIGARQEEHSVVGKESSYRATVARLSDDKTFKIKSSLGTSFRFPALFEMYYVFGQHSGYRESMKAETGKGFDIGFEKSLTDLNLNIDLTFFTMQYQNALEGWSSNTAYQKWGGTTNVESNTRAQGFELISDWKTNDLLDFNLNYTYTSTYDGAEHDNPDLLADYVNSQMVRVPRHFLNLSTNYKWPKTNLDLSLRTKVSSKARDYGNDNTPSFDAFKDVHLDGYMVNDLSLNYSLFGMYDVYFDINNILNKEYETALDYASMERSYNFGFKRSY